MRHDAKSVAKSVRYVRFIVNTTNLVWCKAVYTQRQKMPQVDCEMPLKARRARNLQVADSVVHVVHDYAFVTERD